MYFGDRFTILRNPKDELKTGTAIDEQEIDQIINPRLGINLAIVERILLSLDKNIDVRVISK